MTYANASRKVKNAIVRCFGIQAKMPSLGTWWLLRWLVSSRRPFLGNWIDAHHIFVLPWAHRRWEEITKSKKMRQKADNCKNCETILNAKERKCRKTLSFWQLSHLIYANENWFASSLVESVVEFRSRSFSLTKNGKLNKLRDDSTLPAHFQRILLIGAILLTRQMNLKCIK